MLHRVVRRPIAVLMISLAAALFGLLSYEQLSIALMPPLTYPSLTVQAQYTGASPEEVEAELTNLIEERLSTLEGLMKMESRSSAGLSEVTLSLRWSASLDSALQRIHERIDRIKLPDEVDPPQILRYDPTLEPLIIIALSPERHTASSALTLDHHAQASLAEVRRYAIDVLSPLLYQIEGVAAVKVTGGEQGMIDVRLKTEALQRHGLTVEEVRGVVSAAHVNQAGGLLHTDQGDILIRTISELKSIEQIKSLVVRAPTSNLGSDTSSSRGVMITLGEIAEITRTYQKRTSWVQVDEDPAIRVQVYRLADSDLVEVSRTLKSLLFGKNSNHDLTEVRPLKVPHPEGVKAALISDQAHFIERALEEVSNAIFLGGLFAVLILYAFLSAWSQTMIVAVSIPLSVILTFIPLQWAGVSLNLMSLGGLALGVGMLVDNAVVVLESISRYRERGERALQAAISGASEVGGAVFASTLTTIAVFAPVAFIEGFAGQLFRDLALTVVSALSASLLVALFIVPTLSARAPLEIVTDQELPPSPAPAPRMKLDHLKRWLQGFSTVRGLPLIFHSLSLPLVLFEWLLCLTTVSFLITSGLLWLICKTLTTWPLRFLLIFPQFFARLTSRGYRWIERGYLHSLSYSTQRPIWVIVTAGVILLISFQLQSDLSRVLLPEVSQGVIIADLEYPVGTHLDATTRRVERWVKRLRARAEVSRVDLVIGQDDANEQPGERRGVHQARLTILLKAQEDEQALQDMMRRWGQDEAGARLSLSTPNLIKLSAPLRVVLEGHDLPTLAQAEEQVYRLLREDPLLRDVERTMGKGFPEIKLEYDYAKLAHQGLNPQDVANQLRAQLSGKEALEVIWDGERIPVLVRAEYAERLDHIALSTLPIHLNELQSRQVPLGSMARSTSGEGPSEIRHVDGARAAEVTAQLPATELNRYAELLQQRLKTIVFPAGIDVQVSGQERDIRDSLKELIATLFISLFLVFVVMAAQFESIHIPLLIMGSVPLALAGVVLGLWVTQTPISVVVFVGMITLGGVVVNNAIVFLDAAERARISRLDLPSAIMHAGERRLRPIMMTTLTTICGLIPMLLTQGEGSELRSPLALTLIFGLTSSTLLVLYVIPALYQLTTRDLSRAEVSDEKSHSLLRV